MTPDDFDFLPLKVTHIDEGGRRCFDPKGKCRLIEACQKPGASVAGLALKAGVNANQLRKWIMLERRRADSRNAEKAADARAPAFVPVVEVVDSGPMRISSRPPTPDALPSAPTRRETIRASQRPPLPSRLLVDLPNGVSLELECTGQDSLLLRTMIDALRAR